MSNRLVQLDVLHLRLGLRNKQAIETQPTSHCDTIVTAALLADGTCGFGQALPQTQLTGETINSIFYHISSTFSPLLDHLEPKTFVDLLDFVDQLPLSGEQDQLVLNARASVELALLDVYARSFGCHLSNIIGWLGFGPFITCEAFRPPAVSAILDASEPQRLARQVRGYRWRGFKDYKLLFDGQDDEMRLKIVIDQLGPNIRDGQVSLRADAQGLWDVDQAIDMSETLARHDVSLLEQPLAVNDQSHSRILADLCKVPLMADESLLTIYDAEHLAREDLVDYFNLSINKNGGLIPAIRLAEFATKTSHGFGLGAALHEPAILAAAGTQFMQLVPDTVFTEIGYGRKALKEDVCTPRVGFNFRGKLKQTDGKGWGIELNRNHLSKYLQNEPRQIHLA